MALAITADRAKAESAAIAGRLPPLLIAAERIAATVTQGVHGRRRVGSGDVFWQHRPYYPGDELKQLDWRQSAKSDKIYLRQMEWSAAQSVYLWCDLSPSMDYASKKDLPTKAERSMVLLLALSSVLSRAGERRQIGLVESCLTMPFAAYLSGQRFGPRLVAAMDQHVGTGRCQFGRDIVADAVGRARDQHRLAGHVHIDALLEPPFRLNRNGGSISLF